MKAKSILTAACLLLCLGIAGCGEEPDLSPKALPEGVIRVDKNDNTLQIQRSWWVRGIVSNSVRGRVRNNTTDMTYKGLMIHVVVKNEVGKIVDMKADKIDSLGPGEIWHFDVRLRPFLLEKGLRYEIIGFDFKPDQE